jgi:hypothetical protein
MQKIIDTGRYHPDTKSFEMKFMFIMTSEG